MARRALVLAGWVCSTLVLTFAACDGDETLLESAHAGEGGETTSSGGTSTSGTAGEGEGGAAARGGTRGGDGARGGDAGQSGGTAGTSSSGASSGGSTGGSATGGGDAGGSGGDTGSDGGAAGSGTPDPVVCDRIGATPSIQLAERVAVSYDLTRHRDCRVAWFETLFLPPVDKRLEYLRAIARQTRILWGCLDEPTSGFSLIYTPTPLSQAEVDALIQIYLNESRIEAQLSPAEIAPIERALRQFAEPLIDSSLGDFSRSRCPDGGTTDGGSTGGGGGQGGIAADF